MDETTADLSTLIPTPPSRRRPNRVPGVPVILADGREWQLPFSGLTPVFDEVRDRFYAASMMRRPVDLSDVRLVAWMCLLEDYDLTSEEACLLLALEPDRIQSLVNAVITSIFGCQIEGCGVSFTEYVQSAFLSNGIDPQSVPRHLVSPVLDQLVRTGRALPANQAITAAIEKRNRARIFQGA